MDTVNIIVIVAACIMLVFQIVEVFTDHDFGITEAYLNFFEIIWKLGRFVFRAVIITLCLPFMLINEIISKKSINSINGTKRTIGYAGKRTQEYVRCRNSRYGR